MSRFEFRTAEIDQALAQLYMLKAELLEQELCMIMQQLALSTQKSEATERINDAIKVTRKKLMQQYDGTYIMIQSMKNIKRSVSAAEAKAIINQEILGILVPLPYIYNLVYDAGWTKSTGRAFSILSNVQTLMQTTKTSSYIGPSDAVGVSGNFFGISGSTKAEGGFLYVKTEDIKKVNWKLTKDSDYVGAEFGKEGSFSLLRGEIESDYGLLSTDIEGSVGEVSAKGKVKGVLFEDGKFDPELALEAEAEVKGVTVENETQFGTEDFNIHSEQEATLGYANAEAEFSVGDDGVSVGAEAGAYIARGKAKTGFTLFGISIDAEAEANFGGASIGGEFNASSDEISFGVEGGLLAGLGIKIKISW